MDTDHHMQAIHQTGTNPFALDLVNPRVLKVSGNFSLPGMEGQQNLFFPSLSLGVPSASAQHPKTPLSPFYLNTSNADAHCPNNFQMLLNEVFQLGNATTLQGERRDMENQLHFNLLFTLIQCLQPLKAAL